MQLCSTLRLLIWVWLLLDALRGLDVTGVKGGTYDYNMGALINGHVYLSSLSGGKVSPFKIYYWETPTSNPEVIANINVGNIPGAGNRHGDNASYNIDENGNGFIFFGDALRGLPIISAP